MKRLILVLSLIILTNCSNDVSTQIPLIKGYWEIVNVKKDNKIVKEYTISTTVDYFEVKDDLTGYRKKVSPNLNGKFMVTQHEIPFSLITENNLLQIEYNSNNVTFIETIKKVTKEELIITNAEGFIYTYKPYTPINIE
ncbi:hypothetical protein [Pontimicrobium sp. IMCC45349]|uniref:hypothetical protein n=1 Tax=Pontimicrobium sp. IMCC45349 TaxID=3391574 RepID=UPI0039A3F859